MTPNGQVFFQPSGVFNKPNNEASKLKRKFNKLHKKHIEALKAKNLILANDIGLDIHNFLFKIKQNSTLAISGMLYKTGPLYPYSVISHEITPGIADILLTSFTRMNLEKGLYEIFIYLDFSTIQNIRKEQHIKFCIKIIKEQMKP